MTYIALLRAINVGGNSIVSMADIKAALAAQGLTEVRTWINSGNVIFSAPASDLDELTARVERALQIQTLLFDAPRFAALVGAIPDDWVDDKTMRTYVLSLWPDVDAPDILERLPSREGIDDLLYTPGAVIWRVDRDKVTQSRINRLVGTPLYKRITIRSANTMRKLVELAAR